MQHGVRGRKLESIRTGGGVFTSFEAIERFHDALNGTNSQPTQRRRQHIEQAKRFLDAEGI